MMTIKNKASEIYSFLDEVFPNVGCELNYNKDYELVIAVMLSAQTTDASVNKVTPVLFDSVKEYRVVTANSWLDYGGYAFRKLLPPTASTMTEIHLCGTRKQISVTQ